MILKELSIISFFLVFSDAAATRRQQRVNKDRLITLLIVDDENFDW